MAKPIRSTPTLVGEEANKFVERMLKAEKSRVTSGERKFSKEMEENMKLLVVC